MGTITRIGELDLVDDMSPANWVIERVHEHPVDVGAVVPSGFACYARLFHPAYRYISSNSNARWFSWAEVAEESGGISHAGMQWEKIRQSWDTGEEPAIGTLPQQYVEFLSTFLRDHTESPESCWFGVWEGMNPVIIPKESTPVFTLSQYRFYLLHGTLAGLRQNYAPSPIETRANLAWPEDRSWVIGTNVDLRSTYIGASMSCIDKMLASPHVEAARVHIDAPVTLGSDTLNA